jgi:hypothetical protein
MAGTTDLEVKMFGANAAHLLANTQRGHAWLRWLVTDDDPPFRMQDGRFAVVVTKDDLPAMLDNPTRAGLSL